ncbi:hypothetical protein [Longimicrobium sp.]|uniref:hypothetical protein n=1 Tax=Longimicrobium sp. TaxID=2029185 RepID=UPI003B3A5681
MSETNGHDHDHGGEEEGFGVALGFRIFEAEGGIYMAEAEISSYVDDPNSLGATLVFHSLTELDPTSAPDDDEDDNGWRIDIDDELTRTEGAPMRDQFHAILRQLAGLGEDDLRAYLTQAREETGSVDEDEGQG